jgi:hypothetical protein
MLPGLEQYRLYRGDDGRGKLDVYGFGGVELSGQAGPGRAYSTLAVSPFFWGEAIWRENWYARFYDHTSNEEASLRHFTGVARSIGRAGMKTAELDQAVVGYRNDWGLAEFGRGREIWGPFAEDNIILSGDSPAWDRLVLQAGYGPLTYRYTYGFLEAKYSPANNLPILRYLVGRALEYRNRRNLVLGLREITILAGENRPIDLAHLNPLGFELDAELNNRETVTENYSNAIWAFDMDWLLHPGIRLAGTLLIDEWKFEASERDNGYQNQIAYTGRLAWTPHPDRTGLTLFATSSHIGTYTFQHVYPYANFVSRDRFLGLPLGTDADRHSLGARYLPVNKLLTELEITKIRQGENSLSNHPYRGHVDIPNTPFPSPPVATRTELDLSVWYFFSHRIQFSIISNLILLDNENNRAENRLAMQLRLRYP